MRYIHVWSPSAVLRQRAPGLSAARAARPSPGHSRAVVLTLFPHPFLLFAERRRPAAATHQASLTAADDVAGVQARKHKQPRK